MNRFAKAALAISPLIFLLLGGCGSDGGRLRVQLSYDEAATRLNASVTRDLVSGETLHLRVRQGEIGELNCAADSGSIERIDGNEISWPFDLGPTFAGPVVDPTVFDNPYDNSWLDGTEPTPEMIAAAMASNWIVDVCLMNGAEVVLQDSMDIREALDELGSNGKFDGEDEERIVSGSAYAEACIAELGEIPFFEKIADGDYTTYNCLDSTPIPTTVTMADEVTFPEEQQSVCDQPQYIYSLCEPNAVSGRTNGPRVTSGSNEQGTHWVLLCRKAKSEEGEYNDIAMIGSNPYTGRTCFFQNALYSQTDGTHVPHPADHVESEESPQEFASLWRGIEGGIGSGIECAECHSYDAFIHSPWIDGALDANGDPVVPKMGIDDDFALGFLDAPYSLVNAQGQGWTMPRTIESQGAAACRKCHRISDDRWTNSWLDRIDGRDSSWVSITTEAYHEFEHAYWMPPDLEGLSADNYAQSEYGRSLDHIRECARNPSTAGCEFGELPQAQLVDVGEPPTIDLEGVDLAMAGAKVFGANVVDPSDENCTGEGGSCQTRRCAECHAVGRAGLRHWLELTNQAWNVCGLDRDPQTLTQEEAMRTVDCMRVDSSDPNSVFAAEKLGINTTGVQYGYFRELFRQAFGDSWLPEYLRFRARVQMPKGSHPRLNQIEYATIVKWFQAGLNDLDTVIQSPPPPDSCENMIAPELATHISTMKFDGWDATNRDSGIRMFGCASADPAECFATNEDRASTWGNGTGSLRLLTTLGFRTSFWTRSSADGRFVGNGGGNSGATITDLQRGIDIGVHASYDPGFFPDNTGWVFQGSGAHICQQSILETDTNIDFSEPECMTARDINLYQHVARGLSGGDYFIINSQFTSDSGSSNNDPSANFDASSTMKFSPMVFTGSTYQQLPAVIVDSPYEGDSVLSPSTQLVVSRISGPEGASLGYSIRRVDTSRTGDNYNVNINTQLARVCIPGAKPNISFDERFFVTHHYEDGGANIYLTDMLTGEVRQITNMGGNKALYPHFRSDGWFYFLVHDGDTEHIMASDAAIVMRTETPTP